MKAKGSFLINGFKISLLAVAVMSCATSSSAFQDIDYAVSTANFSDALNALVFAQEAKKPLYNEKNSISLFLDKGLLEHYAGNYAASSTDLQNAERLIEEAYTKSITQGFLSFIVNDNTKEYPGEDFEDIYLNIFNALNYYNRGNLEGALVEIRKLTLPSGKLDLLARKHEYKDPNSGESLSEMSYKETGISEMPETKAVNFSNSALARYLSAVFYKADKNNDSAQIEFAQIHRAFSANENLYRFPVPKAVEEAQNVPDGKASLNILSFTGLSPVKEEQKIQHFLPFMNPIFSVANFKLPILTRRPNKITGVEVIVEGAGASERFNLELMEDISAVIEETYNARLSSITAKTYIRTIIKYVIADITIGETAKRSESLAFLAAVGTRAALEASESADIRMSRFLPDKAYIGAINLDPGTYSVIINYYHGNNVISSDRRTNVNVSGSGLNLIQSVNLN